MQQNIKQATMPVGLATFGSLATFAQAATFSGEAVALRASAVGVSLAAQAG
jgi:hypothetical protein